MAFSDKGKALLAQLRLQRIETATQDPKPVFGPDPTPAIFAKKWSTKFHDHFETFPVAPTARQLHLVPEFLNNTFNLTTAFKLESKHLKITESDVKAAIPQELVGSERRKKHFTSPFQAAYECQVTVDSIYYTYFQFENKGVPGGVAASKLQKQRYLDEMEAACVRVFEAIEAGDWIPVSVSYNQQWKEAVRMASL